MAAADPALILVLGGARSGKSAYAEALAAGLGRRVLYVATAQALDEEMRARVAAHRSRRPAEWGTLEAPLGAGAALEASPEAAAADAVLVDCLTLLVSNAILSVPPDGVSGGPETPEPSAAAAWPAVQAEIDALLAAHRRLGVPMIVVSNEVGLGLVPATALGRTYRDCLGWANQALARTATQVVLLIAGLPVDLKSLPLAWLPLSPPRGRRGEGEEGRI